MSTKPLKVEVPEQPKVYYYTDPLKDNYRLERYLFDVENIDFIGDYLEVPKCRVLLNGDIRPSGMDMTELDRAYRSYCVTKLSYEGLLKVHEFERTKCKHFLIREQMEKISGEKIPEIKWSSQIFKLLQEFNKLNHPSYNREYKGFKIPAFFMYSHFDGMTEWHHPFDLEAWNNKHLFKTNFISEKNNPGEGY